MGEDKMIIKANKGQFGGTHDKVMTPLARK